MPTVGVEFAKVSYTPAGGHLVLRDISLALEHGTTTALLGRSGSGKTTLLRMVNGLVRPDSGEVTVLGRSLSSLETPEQWVELRRKIGYVVQETGLFPHMTVERNAGLSLELEGRPGEEIASVARKNLQRVGLDFDRFRKRLPWQLSGGQRQRVGLARALALAPPVLLMDEPFGALDPLTRGEMQDMLRELLTSMGKTVLLVTHDLNEALYLADRVIILANAEVAADLSAKEVLTSENPQVKHYISSLYREIAG